MSNLGATGMIGERVGDWVIDGAVGQDHHGLAYRAHAADDPGKLATVKVLTGGQSAEFHDLFRGRLLVLRKLSHPNLVTYLGGGVVHNDPYFVAEHVPGPDYQTLLREGKRPPWPDVLSYALQCVSALRHAHRRGVLHGDLKPANLILTPDGRVKLAEAGIARLFGVAVPPPGDNPLASAAFISPEQAAGKQATKRSDFYSLGCLLYALLTGRPPFTSVNLVELIHKHCFVMPERPAHYLRDLPDEFDGLVMKLLAKDPQVRHGSGTLLLTELERVWSNLEARGKVAKRPPLPVDDPLPPPADAERPAKARKVATIETRPRPLMSRPWVVVPLFLLCVGALVGGFYLSRTDPDDLYARAQPLMRSDDPADWEKAWTEYLEPLSREYPDKYADEIKAFRARTQPLAELRRAQAGGRNAKYTSEAERFYHEGLRLVEAGDFAGARRTWERVAAAFAGVESEARWVELARQ
ncbi:MAG TPA: serine/threonine-protein kinase, partial [Gemmataceae bacterium]|nr:serine/threonine-protein kinase [Gemmataceae bacterium]